MRMGMEERHVWGMMGMTLQEQIRTLRGAYSNIQSQLNHINGTVEEIESSMKYLMVLFHDLQESFREAGKRGVL